MTPRWRRGVVGAIISNWPRVLVNPRWWGLATHGGGAIILNQGNVLQHIGLRIALVLHPMNTFALPDLLFMKGSYLASMAMLMMMQEAGGDDFWGDHNDGSCGEDDGCDDYDDGGVVYELIYLLRLKWRHRRCSGRKVINRGHGGHKPWSLINRGDGARRCRSSSCNM